LAIKVRNAEASVDFYRRMFGMEPLKVRKGYAKFDVQNPPLNFTLNEVPFQDAGALSHMGIQVSSTEEVLAIRQKWANAGLVPRDEMQTACCYALQDKAWVRDPDGNEWEVFAVLADLEQSNNSCCQPGESTASEGCASSAGLAGIEAQPLSKARAG
jgi:catechol 2,3-dioxygenase-like lactoylglutathione lyase family enzyme